MSLMNDALRKKNRETTGSPAAPGFSDVSQHPRTTRKWFAVMAATILLTAAALAGIHLIQSAPGKAMLVKSLLPERSQPPVNRAADITSVADHQADVTPIQASSGGKTETKGPEEPTKENRFATDDLESAPLPSTVDVTAPHTISSQRASVSQPAIGKPATTAVSNESTTIEAPVESSQRNPGAVSRTFEPGPDQIVPREKTAPAAPRPPAHIAPSPASRGPTETIGQRSAGAADRKTAKFDQDTDPFFKKALAYHRSGRLADAVRLYRQVLKTNASHQGAMLNLAAAYMEQGNYYDAHPLLKRLEPSTPRPEGVLLNLAISAIGMGTPEKALDYLDRSEAASDASSWEIRFHRAVAFVRMNRLPEALALYRDAETERPDDPLLQFNLAVTCDTLGMYPEALAHYEAVLQTPPGPSATDKETIIQRIRTIRRYLDTAPSPAKGQ